MKPIQSDTNLLTGEYIIYHEQIVHLNIYRFQLGIAS